MKESSVHNFCLCITGWHFPAEFYASVKKYIDCDCYVVAHVPQKNIPEYVYDAVGFNHVLIRRNIGYDWGCYQQFLESGIWKKYGYIFFLHDDVTIKNNGFIDASQNLLTQGYSVIGNGRPFPPRPWPKTHPESYAHAVWTPPSDNFCHDIVRGSFFATNRQNIEKVENFEVYWDRQHFSTYFGNWSLRSTCGKFQDLFGERCFGFLSDTWCESEYLSEFVRGEKSSDTIPVVGGIIDKFAAHWIHNVARLSMKQYWQKDRCRATCWRDTILQRLIQRLGAR
ncbi:MAG: hypothetical protein D3909_00445 [Candidatus Electrothrix sp. ATG1]|nr:hypothetical protein [Candidatus Electrothrix sp. ATG1]